MCVLSFAAFLRFSEIVNLQCLDTNFMMHISHYLSPRVREIKINKAVVPVERVYLKGWNLILVLMARRFGFLLDEVSCHPRN